jgi:predicted TIM-barrel fold metal-dependent hydrolase
MNVPLRDRAPALPVGQTRLAIADCDLHLGPPDLSGLFPFLAQRWRHYIQTYGVTHRIGWKDGGPAYPKAAPFAARRDAFPPDGAPPGTNLAFTRTQHLDAFNVQLGLINPPTPSQSPTNGPLANALATAWNDWQIESLVRPEPRLRASVVVNYEDPVAAVAEIERCAGQAGFGHVLFLSRIAEPLGAPKYLPILEAATAARLPVAMHAFGFAGRAPTSGGWPSFYLEDMVAHANAFQAHLASMVCNGVFERLPGFRFVMIEGGFGWLPSFCWRLDKLYHRMRDELPHVSRLPSEAIRAQVWTTTQPMEEPTHKVHLADLLDWIGWDRLLFASDYPHWDFDNPDLVLPAGLTEAQRYNVMIGNALALYGSNA